MLKTWEQMTNGALTADTKKLISKLPGERDPRRAFTKEEKAGMLEKQGGKCAQCGVSKKINEVHGHHVKRHADGGRTTTGNGAAVCKDCHTQIHQ